MYLDKATEQKLAQLRLKVLIIRYFLALYWAALMILFTVVVWELYVIMPSYEQVVPMYQTLILVLGSISLIFGYLCWDLQHGLDEWSWKQFVKWLEDGSNR